MTLQDLPLDLLLEMAKSHVWVGCELSKTVRRVGQFSLENDMKRWFKVEENNETFILVKSSKEPYCEKLRHSWDDKLAVIDSDGSQMWYKEGMIHRDDDKPAIIYSCGRTQQWFKEGRCHRDGDKPAIILSGGFQAWYNKGERYKDNE